MTHPSNPRRGGARPARTHATVVVIGAGPAGLTAAYQLGKLGASSTVLEADTVVGGISRTVERDGWRFDIGGHRFFTKVQRGRGRCGTRSSPDDDFLSGPRMSRIYYDGKFFDYPLRAFNALRSLGLVEAIRCVLSYLWVRDPSAEGPDDVRGLDRGPLRLAALPHVLQDLHREGVGRAGHRDPGRLGRATDQEPVAVQRRRSTRCCRSATRRTSRR